MAAVEYDYKAVAERAVEALRGAFPNSVIETEESYRGRVHVRIVSPSFNGKNEQEKQALLWDVLRAELEDDAQAVTLALAYGMDELP
jgi:stress-induced morphogen